MSRHSLFLPIPPLALGVSWTGKKLLRYCLDDCDRRNDKATKAALVQLVEILGPDKFKETFEKQAKALNERFSARSADGERGPGVDSAHAITLEVN